MAMRSSLAKSKGRSSGFDVPLVKSLNAMFFEMNAEWRAPATKPVNGSKALYGHGHLAPTWVKERPSFSPLMLYSFDQTMDALNALRSSEGSPYDGISLEYTNPQTGGPGFSIQMVAGDILVQAQAYSEGTQQIEHDGPPTIHARDKQTGEILGSVELPAPPQYGMMTYMHEGKQYIVVQAGSAKRGEPGSLVALRLPD